MTPEQLDEIEKLAEAQEFLRVGSYALPLVKALREAQKERDEARAEVARMKARPAETEYSRLDGMWQQLVRERDEARAEVEMLRGVGCGELREGAEVPDGPCGACLKCARRERDEARAELEHAVAEGGALYEAKVAQGEAEQELDEARAKLEEQREIIEWMNTATFDAGGDTTLICSFCGVVEMIKAPIFFIALAKRVIKQRKQHAACRLPKEGEA